MDSLITVVVPVYNVEKYLEKCVNSICNQTYKNIEVILVNDGSTDNSGKICDELEKKDIRIRAIHKKNGGLSDARNYGIKLARGEYISFIDSDDYIEPNMMELLINNIYLHTADISVCAYDMVYKDKIDVISECIGVQIYSSDEAFKVLLRRNNIGVIACNKLYKYNLLQDIEYPIGKYFEDINTTYKIIANATTIVYDPQVLYHYIQREDSINGVNFKRTSFNKSTYDMANAADELLEFVKKSKKNALPEISIGCFDYYIRVINQEIIYKINNSELVNKTRRLGRRYISFILRADFINFKKKLQFILFIYFFTLYKFIVKLMKG